jgi:tRNA (guanine10-N2)-methyltransferase
VEGLDKIAKFDIFANFKHYGLPLPNILAMDISSLQFNMNLKDHLSVRPVFDAIVCDPPYGVRARSQKVGIRDSRKNKPEKEKSSNAEDEPYFAQKEHFDFIELHDHLLDVAATLLVPGGRLVFLFHTDEVTFDEEKARFPQHPQLRFVHSARDQLTKQRARHLITMKKVV